MRALTPFQSARCRLDDLAAALRHWTRTLGPYVLIEIVMPGGTLLALLLFLYRQRAKGTALGGWRDELLRRLPLLALVRARG